MRFIFARLIDLSWYWFVGFRYGDSDGIGKLRYLARWYAGRAEQRRTAIGAAIAPTSISSPE